MIRIVSLMTGGENEVMVQGNSYQLYALLSSLGVPKRWIKDSGIADRKKKGNVA